MKKGIAMRFIVLTADMLSQFYYQNGVVFRKSTARPTAIHKNKQGYGRTKVDSRYVYMKRLVWALHHGDPGAAYIDHINHNIADDQIENLRLATPSQNAAYRRHKKGYWYCNKSQKWKVAIQYKLKTYNGGAFQTEEEAKNTADNLKQLIFKEFSIFKGPVL